MALVDDHFRGVLQRDMRQIDDQVVQVRIGNIMLKIPLYEIAATAIRLVDEFFRRMLIAVLTLHDAFDTLLKRRDDPYRQS